MATGFLIFAGDRDSCCLGRFCQYQGNTGEYLISGGVHAATAVDVGLGHNTIFQLGHVRHALVGNLVARIGDGSPLGRDFMDEVLAVEGDEFIGEVLSIKLWADGVDEVGKNSGVEILVWLGGMNDQTEGVFARGEVAHVRLIEGVIAQLAG